MLFFTSKQEQKDVDEIIARLNLTEEALRVIAERIHQDRIDRSCPPTSCDWCVHDGAHIARDDDLVSYLCDCCKIRHDKGLGPKQPEPPEKKETNP